MSNKDRQRKQNRFDDVKHTVEKLEALIEVFALMMAYFIIWKYKYRPMDFYPYYGSGKYILVGVYAFLIFVLFWHCDAFKFGHLKLTDVFISQVISTFLVNIVTYLQICLMAKKMVPVYPMALLFAFEIIAEFILVYIYTGIYHRLYIPKNMIMIYGNDDAVTLKFKMDERSDKYKVNRLISIEEGYEKICRSIADYDAVIINDVSAEIRNDILKFCYENKIRTYVTPKLTDILISGADDITLFDTPLKLVDGHGFTLTQRAVKRTMDLVLCLIAMIPAAPIMLIVALCIKIEDRGPVFFKQERVTRDGKKFDILKFRSMIVDAEKEGKSIPATGRDSRITKVGRVIRATRLDELPQLLNIIKGDMSIVGPRPERTEHVEKYSEEIPEFPFRLKVKGGLTGYAQIYGKYNTTAYDKLRLDLMYIENYSILLDIKLILMTLRIMIKPESTEGFEKQKELDAMKEEILSECAVTSEDADNNEKVR